MQTRHSLLFCLLALAFPGCGGDDDQESEPVSGACDIDKQTGCATGEVCATNDDGEAGCYCNSELNTGCPDDQACEVLTSGLSGCFSPVTLTGKVFDLKSGDGIEGARVVARDINLTAQSGVAVTDENGDYSLAVRAVRDADGNIVDAAVLLRADAQAYESFPFPPRQALPIDLTSATGEPPSVANAATDIGMIGAANADGTGTISGVVNADAPGGALVVAGGKTAVADADGGFTVFNIAPGDVSVTAYKAGFEFETESVSVKADSDTDGVEIDATGDATAVVSGMVSIVNGGNGTDTSVILALDETFVESAARGEPPPGLRVGNVSGAWEIPNVPSGKYVVLAGFENDFLVRDPDQSIGGTSLVRITVDGSDVVLDTGFKITGSLDNPSPDSEEEVTGTPVFKWDDDSGEDHYEVFVFDAYGTQVWEELNVPGVSGSKQVEVPYAGPALETGSLYQFKAFSIKKNGARISATEDLRGVFVYR